VFNFLGPLANPGRVRRQVVGVSDPAMADKVAGVLQRRQARRALVVYGHDGLDELSTTGPSTVVDVEAGQTTTYVVDPRAFGLAPATRAELAGGDAAANAGLARAVLDGESGRHRDIVLLNAAAGLVVAGVSPDLAGGLQVAAEVIDDGRAGRVLDDLVRVSKEAAA
jgi:anthranilate phosphoribosyltransferase